MSWISGRGHGERPAAGLRRYSVLQSDSAKSALARLIEFGNRLADEDLESLNAAVTDLAHGNLAARVSPATEPLDRRDFPGMEPLVDVFNRFCDGLKRAGTEFNSATDPPCLRLCYVGADSFLEGVTCGQALGGALDGRGRVAILYSSSMLSNQLRRKGFRNALQREYPGVSVIREGDSGLTAEDGFRHTAQVLRDEPELDGIYFTHGGVPVGAAKAVEQAGKAGRVRIVCHDFGDATLQYVRQGVITATLGQDPYAQGHDPVIHLFNHLVAGWQPPTPRLLTRLQIATAENCTELMGSANRQNGRYVAPVARKAPTHLRIAVLGRAPSSFWDVVRAGVEEAAEELRALNASAEWLVPEAHLREGKVSAEVYAPLLESILSQGYDGVALGIFDGALVPDVNRASRSGIPIVTFNSEPSGLGSMVKISTDQAAKLLAASQQMAASIDQLTQATQQIKISIDQVSRATVSQNEQVNRANESLDALVNRVDAVTREASEGSALASNAAEASSIGTDAVARTLGSMNEIQSSVSSTGQSVARLGSSSDRIDVIVKMIGGIASQIKLLGINAAIEAAHAGNYGAGFSVVAGEIRSLGERSSTATREISWIVEAVQKEICEAQRLMSSELQQVEAGAHLAERAGKLLGDIREAVETSKDRLSTIATRVTQIQDFSRQVGGVMQELTAITEENSAAAEEVGAAANEMLGELGRINSVAHSLAEMAMATEQLLAKFTLRESDS